MALYGVEKTSDNTEWKCLQVGQSSNMGREIDIDMNYLYQNNSFIEIKNYVNQFGKKMFEYSRIASIQELLYSHIAEKYHKFIFICVLEEADQVKRKKFEKCFAWLTNSLYWRNGGTYIDEKNYTELVLEKQKSEVLSNRELKNEVLEVTICIQKYLENIKV